MIKVNLLPENLEIPQSQTQPAIPILVAGVLPLLFIIPWHLKQLRSDQELLNEIAKKKSRLSELQPVIEKIESLESARTQLNNRKGVIQQLEEERLRYPKFMDDFLKLIPGNIWLNSLTTLMQASGNTMNISIDVSALDNYAIADLISNMETSQIFTDVDLGVITATMGANQNQTMNFRITANYKKANVIPDATKKS